MYQKTILIGVFVLIATGPPRLPGSRELEQAFRSGVLQDTDYLLQIVAWAIAGIALALIMSSRVSEGRLNLSRKMFHGPAKWYLSYGLVALFSATYSAAPAYTAFFASKILISWFVVSYLLQYGTPEVAAMRVLKIFGYVYAVGFLFLVVLFFVDPLLVGMDRGVYRLSGGPLGGYGTEALVTGIFALVYIRHYSESNVGRLVAMMVYALTWLFVLMSLTRQTMFLAAFAFVLIGLTGDLSPKRVVALLFFSVVLTVMIIADWGWNVIVEVFGFATREMSGLETLTGRTIVAAYLIPIWLEAPVFGHGFASGSRLALLEFVYTTGMGMGTAHSSFVRALIEVGIVGTGLMIVAFSLAWYEAIRFLRAPSKSINSRVLGKLLLIAMVSATLSLLMSDGLAEGELVYVMFILIASSVSRRLS